MDFSKSSVVKIMDSYNYRGSGFVVDEHTIATAAHCVLDEQLSEILLFNSNGGSYNSGTKMTFDLIRFYLNNNNIQY